MGRRRIRGGDSVTWTCESSPLRGKAKGKGPPLCGQVKARHPVDPGGASHPKPGRPENSSPMSAKKEGP